MHDANEEFQTYLRACRRLLKLDDVEFAFLYPEDFDAHKSQFNSLLNARFYRENKFSIRVYRRGNLADFKDLNKDMLSTKDTVTETDIEKFIYRSTFVGKGPDIIREISTDNVRKIFS